MFLLLLQWERDSTFSLLLTCCYHGDHTMARNHFTVPVFYNLYIYIVEKDNVESSFWEAHNDISIQGSLHALIMHENEQSFPMF